MAQAFRACTVAGLTGSPLVIAKPAGVIDGDILVFAGAGNDSNQFGILSGWTNLYNQVSGTLRLQVLWKLAASEPTSYSWTSAHAISIGVMGAISGCQAAVDGSSVKLNPSAASTVLGTAFTTVDPSLVLLWIALRSTVSSSGALTKPTNHTKRNPSDVYAGGSILDPTIVMASEVFAGAGATMFAADTNGSLSGGNTGTSIVAMCAFKNALPSGQPLLFCEA